MHRRSYRLLTRLSATISYFASRLGTVAKMVTIGADLGKGVMAQMTVKRITSDVVNRLRPGERVSDDKLPGFRVRRQTTIRRVYEFNYYINGVRKQMKIGGHGMVTRDGITSWTPEGARREAKRLAGLVAQGI